MYNITLSALSAKKLVKFDNLISQRIEIFLDQKLRIDPKKYSIPLINRKNLLRARVGDYRIIFEIQNKNSIFITDIDHRSKIYK